MSSTSLRARVALAEIEALGLTIEDLLAVAERDPAIRPTPLTLGDYVPVVAAAYQPRTRRTYNSYWRLAVELIGDVAMERVTVDDCCWSPRMPPGGPRSGGPVAMDARAERAASPR